MTFTPIPKPITNRLKFSRNPGRSVVGLTDRHGKFQTAIFQQPVIRSTSGLVSEYGIRERRRHLVPPEILFAVVITADNYRRRAAVWRIAFVPVWRLSSAPWSRACCTGRCERDGNAAAGNSRHHRVLKQRNAQPSGHRCSKRWDENKNAKNVKNVEKN